MKRKLVLTKKFPFVEFKKTENRRRNWADDILHEELLEATKEQRKVIALYREMERMKLHKRLLNRVSNFKFPKSLDGEYEYGEIEIRVSDGENDGDFGIILKNKSREERKEVLEIIKRAYQKSVSEIEKSVAEMKQEIAND